MTRQPASRSGAGLRVLVIDDDRRVQAAMAAELTAVGWQPLAIGPRDLADHDTGQLHSDFDVALVDVALPTITDGLAVITQLTTRMPVVAFSINGAARDAAIAAGAAAYLEKDGDTDRLLHALHTATATPDRHPPRSGTGPQPPRSSS